MTRPKVCQIDERLFIILRVWEFRESGRLILRFEGDNNSTARHISAAFF